jgi:hypothetical protein
LTLARPKAPHIARRALSVSPGGHVHRPAPIAMRPLRQTSSRYLSRGALEASQSRGLWRSRQRQPETKNALDSRSNGRRVCAPLREDGNKLCLIPRTRLRLHLDQIGPHGLASALAAQQSIVPVSGTGRIERDNGGTRGYLLLDAQREKTLGSTDASLSSLEVQTEEQRRAEAALPERAIERAST